MTRAARVELLKCSAAMITANRCLRYAMAEGKPRADQLTRLLAALEAVRAAQLAVSDAIGEPVERVA